MKNHPGTFALQLSVRSWPLSLKTYALGRRIWNPHWRRSLTSSLDSGMSNNDTRSSESRTDCLKEHVPWDHFRSIFLISPICRTVQMARPSGAQSKPPHSTFQLLKQNLLTSGISYKRTHSKPVGIRSLNSIDYRADTCRSRRGANCGAESMSIRAFRVDTYRRS